MANVRHFAPASERHHIRHLASVGWKHDVAVAPAQDEHGHSEAAGLLGDYPPKRHLSRSQIRSNVLPQTKKGGIAIEPESAGSNGGQKVTDPRQSLLVI